MKKYKIIKSWNSHTNDFIYIAYRSILFGLFWDVIQGTGSLTFKGCEMKLDEVLNREIKMKKETTEWILEK